MSGFLPRGYRPLSEAAADRGQEAIGRDLVSGDVTAYRRDPWGKLHVIEAEYWATASGRQTVVDGHITARRSIPAEYRRPGGPIVREDISPVFIVAPERSLPRAPPRPDRGGRPNKWDWEAALIELARLDAMEGTANKSDPDLIRYLMEWMAKPDGEAPSEGEVRKRVKAWRRVMKA